MQHLPQLLTLSFSISLAAAALAADPAAAVVPPLPVAAAGTKACAAQNILTNCLSVQGLQFSACAYSDWACKCQAQKAVVMCYNNCPGHDARAAQEGQVTVFCNAAMREEEQKSLSQSKSASKTTAASAAQTKGPEPADQEEDESAASRRIKSPSQKNRHAGGVKGGSGAAAAGKGMADAQENGAEALRPSMAALAMGAALWTLAALR
ncbi:hypothetical protein GGI15_002746 [Coemansia interrupta]|uniref:Uncharacterized protein n=1 Tax=Coemansia interrupta TaxID=1126814 RepID=A0A9W8LJU9_9FUNG|nr:hypothetical protein GGI15_002746 [Coemansia interrupta]